MESMIVKAGSAITAEISSKYESIYYKIHRNIDMMQKYQLNFDLNSKDKDEQLSQIKVSFEKLSQEYKNLKIDYENLKKSYEDSESFKLDASKKKVIQVIKAKLDHYEKRRLDFDDTIKLYEHDNEIKYNRIDEIEKKIKEDIKQKDEELNFLKREIESEKNEKLKFEKDRDNLAKLLEEKSHEMNKLNSVITEINEINAILKLNLEKLELDRKNEIENEKIEIAKLTEEKDGLKKQNEFYINEIDSLKKSLIEKSQSYHFLINQNEEISEQMRDKSKQIETLEQDIALTKADLNQKIEAFEALENQLEDLNEKFNEKLAVIDSKNYEIHTLKDKLNENEKVIEFFECKKKEWDDYALTRNTQLDSLEIKIKQLEAENLTIRGEKENFSNEIQLHLKEMDCLNKEIKDLTDYNKSESEKTIKEIRDFIQKIETLENIVNDKDRDIEDLNHKLKISDANIKDISEHFERDKSAYLKENEIERNDFEYLKNQLENTEKTLKKLETEIGKKNLEIENCNKQNAKLRDDINQLKIQNKTNLTDLKNKHEKDGRNKDSEIENLKKKVVSLNDTIKRLFCLKNYLKNPKKDLVNERNGLKKNYDELNKELKKTMIENKTLEIKINKRKLTKDESLQTSFNEQVLSSKKKKIELEGDDLDVIDLIGEKEIVHENTSRKKIFDEFKKPLDESQIDGKKSLDKNKQSAKNTKITKYIELNDSIEIRKAESSAKNAKNSAEISKEEDDFISKLKEIKTATIKTYNSKKTAQAYKEPVVKILPKTSDFSLNLRRMQFLKEERPLMTSTPVNVKKATLCEDLC